MGTPKEGGRPHGWRALVTVSWLSVLDGVHCLQGVEGMQQWAFKAAASALEVIPRTLAQNCGANVVRVLTQLRVRTYEECLFQNHRVGLIAFFRFRVSGRLLMRR